MRQFFAADIAKNPWLGNALDSHYPLPAVPSFRPPPEESAGVLAAISKLTFSSTRPYAFLVAANSVSGFNSRDTPEKRIALPGPPMMPRPPAMVIRCLQTRAAR